MTSASSAQGAKVRRKGCGLQCGTRARRPSSRQKTGRLSISRPVSNASGERDHDNRHIFCELIRGQLLEESSRREEGATPHWCPGGRESQVLLHQVIRVRVLQLGIGRQWTFRLEGAPQLHERDDAPSPGASDWQRCCRLFLRSHIGDAPQGRLTISDRSGRPSTCALRQGAGAQSVWTDFHLYQPGASALGGRAPAPRFPRPQNGILRYIGTRAGRALRTVALQTIRSDPTRASRRRVGAVMRTDSRKEDG
jgi:hypothetical protein